MKKSKSFYRIGPLKVEPLGLPGLPKYLSRERTEISIRRKKSVDEVPGDGKLDKLIEDAETLYHGGNYEDALLLYLKAARLRPNNAVCNTGIIKCRGAIIKEIGASGDFLQPPSENVTEPTIIPTRHVLKTLIQQKEKEMEEKKFKLTIDDGGKYKLVEATFDDLREYFRDRDYFKMKEKTALEQKKYRMELNKGLAEKEAAERYKKQMQYLEEIAHYKRYCDEQLLLIARYYNNNKMLDVVRFTENFIGYLRKKNEKLIPKKSTYLGTCYNYLTRAFIELNNKEKAQETNDKLKEFVLNSDDNDLLYQSCTLSGKFYAKFGMYEEAATAWENAITQTEDAEKKAWLFHEIGRCYYELQKYEESKKFGDQSLEWAEKTENSQWNTSARVLLAQVSLKEGNLEEALSKFKETQHIAEKGKDDKILNYIGDTIKIIEDVLNKKQAISSKENSEYEG